MSTEHDEQATSQAMIVNAANAADAAVVDRSDGTKQPAEANRADIDALIHRARSASEAGRSDVAADLWMRVLALDETSVEARRSVGLWVNEEGEYFERKIRELRGKVRSELISELDDALLLADEILASPFTNEAGSDVVSDLRDQARNKRATMAAESGRIDTLVRVQQFESAIAELEKYISGGRTEFLDVDGNIVSSINTLREYKRAYFDYCTSRAEESLHRAEEYLRRGENPRFATEVLQEALRSLPEADTRVLQHLHWLLREAEELLENWEHVDKLVHEAIRTPDFEQRRWILREADERSRNFPGLAELIGRAKRDLWLDWFSRIDQMVQSVRQMVAVGRFEEARKLLYDITNEYRQFNFREWGETENWQRTNAQIEDLWGIIGDWNHRQAHIRSVLYLVERIISEGKFDEAEKLLMNVLSEASTEFSTESDLRQHVQELLQRISMLRETATLLETVRTAIENNELDNAESLLAALPQQSATEDARIVGLRQQLTQAKERRQRRLEEIEDQIDILFKAATTLFHRRLFVTSNETLDRLPSMINDLPQEKRAQWEVRVSTLRTEISDATTVWSDFAQARAHMWEGQGAQQADYMKEATQLLLRVIRFPPIGTVVSAIQQEARELYDGILLGISVMQGNLEEVEKRLITMLAMSPHDVNIVHSLHRVQATKYLRSFAEQADETRRMARREARSWYIASIVSGVIFAGLFVFAVLYVLLARPDDTLSYLAPLYTFVPGLLSALFLKQYNDANQRLDVEQKLLWAQVEEFERKQMDELSAARPQPPTGESTPEPSAAAPSEPESARGPDG